MKNEDGSWTEEFTVDASWEGTGSSGEEAGGQ